MTEPLVRSGSAHQGRIDAVTFDFWDTICCAPKVDATRAARVERLTGVLHGVSGEPVTEERIEAAVLEVLARFNQHWGENIQFTHVEAVDALSEILGLTLDAEGRATVELAFTGEQRTTVPPLTPNVEVAVRALKDAGVRVGIICDVGLAPSRVLRRHLDHHGLLELFDHWSFSDEVGFYKPAPEIFEHALDGLGGVEPQHAAHIGDLRRTDIAGAQAMGILSLRYSGINDDPAVGPEPIEADHVVHDHVHLPSLLGLA